MGLKFFVLGGAVLIASGVLQALVRPRPPGERGLARVLNAGTLRALVFVSAGVLAILVGLGEVPIRGFGP